MHLIYSENGAKIEGLEGGYRNPAYFLGCEQCDKVTVDKAYKSIADAYKEQGIKVALIGDAPVEDDKPTVNPDKMKVDELKAWLEVQGIKYPSDAAKPYLVELVKQELAQ